MALRCSRTEPSPGDEASEMGAKAVEGDTLFEGAIHGAGLGADLPAPEGVTRRWPSPQAAAPAATKAATSGWGASGRERACGT